MSTKLDAMQILNTVKRSGFLKSMGSPHRNIHMLSPSNRKGNSLMYNSTAIAKDNRYAVNANSNGTKSVLRKALFE